jgi:hypothetical protein
MHAKRASLIKTCSHAASLTLIQFSSSAFLLSRNGNERRITTLIAREKVQTMYVDAKEIGGIDTSRVRGGKREEN